MPIETPNGGAVTLGTEGYYIGSSDSNYFQSLTAGQFAHCKSYPGDTYVCPDFHSLFSSIVIDKNNPAMCMNLLYTVRPIKLIKIIIFF